MAANTSGNEGRGPRRQKKTYWWIVIVVSIASGVGLILYFSIPVFFSPGGGIGAPTNIQEEQQQSPPIRETEEGDLANDVLTQ
jgi:hypothetical protein